MIGLVSAAFALALGGVLASAGLGGVLASAAPDGAVARADAAWAARGAGARDGRASEATADALVAAHERALESGAARLEARWKLLRALHFQGEFASRDAARRRAIFERATALAESSAALLRERTGRLESLSDEALLARLEAAGVTRVDAAGIHFWSAVAWGAWSQTHGLLEAVAEGVADRVYEGARLAHRIDPDFEEGGPQRLLSRLHGTLPRVPWVTGWVERERAVPLAEAAAARWPEHPGNHLLLAFTWLELAPGRRDEALATLSRVAAAKPREAARVEDAAVVRAARERLALERADGERG